MLSREHFQQKRIPALSSPRKLLGGVERRVDAAPQRPFSGSELREPEPVRAINSCLK